MRARATSLPGPSAFVRASSHSYLIGGHANWRDPGRGLIGIFGGAGDATNFFNFSSVRHGLIGGEAQVYWGPPPLYGQGGYQSTLGSISSARQRRQLPGLVRARHGPPIREPELPAGGHRALRRRRR